MRIAIVGDNEAEALLLQELCAELGHDARFAADTGGVPRASTREALRTSVFLSASAFEGRVVALVASHAALPRVDRRLCC